MMKTCNNCLWTDKCPEVGHRCEYYDPIECEENIAIRDYYKDLAERGAVYRELVREQQDLKAEE